MNPRSFAQAVLPPLVGVVAYSVGSTLIFGNRAGAIVDCVIFAMLFVFPFWSGMRVARLGHSIGWSALGGALIIIGELLSVVVTGLIKATAPDVWGAEVFISLFFIPLLALAGVLGGVTQRKMVCPACQSRHTVSTNRFGNSRNPPFENRICQDCGTAFAPECSRWIGILLIVAGCAGLIAWIQFVAPLLHAKDPGMATGFIAIVCISAIVRGIMILLGKARELTILGKVEAPRHLTPSPTAAAPVPTQPEVSPAPTPPSEPISVPADTSSPTQLEVSPTPSPPEITPVTAAPDSPESSAPSFDAEIRALAALRSDGLISEDEFNAKKRAILGIKESNPNA